MGGGGSVYLILSVTAFAFGLVPGIFITWLRMRLDSASMPSVATLVLARLSSALVAGVLIPVVVAGCGLAIAYTLRGWTGGVQSMIPAILGGWVLEGQSRTLGAVALLASWLFYGASLPIAARIERLVMVHRAAGSRRPHSEDSGFAKAVRVTYWLQTFVAFAVWWEIHGP